MNQPVAGNVSRLIREKGLKQAFVAEKAGYTAQQLSDMINGRRLIKAIDIPRLMAGLGATAEELYASGAREGAQAGGNPSGESIAG